MAHPVETLKQIQNEELDQFFEANQNELKPWGRKEWKEQRDNVIGDVCEWCTSEDGPFHIHHTNNGPNWAREWIKATDKAFINSSQYNPRLTHDREECPSCELRDYYERKTKTPTYRCNNCKEEFEEPNHITGAEAITNDKYDTKPYTADGYYKAKADWLQNNRSDAVNAFTELFEDAMDEYIEMTGTVTICQSCHFQEEQTSNQRCDNCGENWHNYKKDMCWDCLVEEKGLVECDCGDGWYQESKYDACSDCR